MDDKYLRLLKNILKDDVKEVTSLFGGMMNEAYIVRTNNDSYVFYVPTEQANEMVDRSLEKQTQDIATSLEITRDTIYFDEKTGVKLLKFIKGDSLNHIKEFDPKKIAELFFKLHSSKTNVDVNYEPFKKLAGYKKDALVFVDDLDSLFNECYKLIEAKQDMLMSHKQVLCHNDGQRSNIVKDLNNKYWLIDYEFAMNNDPLYDIATFGNDDPNDGLVVLKEYIKLAKMDEKEAFDTYCLWRMFISLQWYLVALIKHYRGEGKIHNIDFLVVSRFFLENAKKTKEIYLKK